MANDQRFFKFFATAVRDHGKFRREAFDVRLLAFDEALRDEQRERGVDVAGARNDPVAEG